MTTTFEPSSRTIHLPAVPTAAPVRSPIKRGSLRLSDLMAGQTGRILRVSITDGGCRKRFAELGLAEGMKVTVAATGDTLMLVVAGTRMGLAARCAEQILVSRLA